MSAPPSLSRQRPIASKFSSANPSGSIRRWQFAQTGFLRCASIRSRSDVGCAASLSSSGGTLAGAGGGGAPSSASSTHFPRSTTDVRLAYDVTVRRLA